MAGRCEGLAREGQAPKSTAAPAWLVLCNASSAWRAGPSNTVDLYQFIGQGISDIHLEIEKSAYAADAERHKQTIGACGRLTYSRLLNLPLHRPA
jgi:hypothetical protein